MENQELRGSSATFPIILAILVGLLLAATAVQAGPFQWIEKYMPQTAKPEDPHLYPQERLLYDIWTCKGENEIGWVGVTQQYTDHDPTIVVVARTEFQDQLGFNMEVGVEIHAPRHNRIVASDRVHLERCQDIAFFYHPRLLSEMGGWGEYKAVLCIDGIPKDVTTFRLDRVEDLQKALEEERQKEQSKQAFEQQFTGLEARNLLGEPDMIEGGGIEALDRAPTAQTALAQEKPKPTKPIMETWEPEEWYRTDFTNEEGKIIVFPKRPRASWGEKVEDDMRYRIKRYVYDE
jgi:hypothetical protein